MIHRKNKAPFTLAFLASFILLAIIINGGDKSVSVSKNVSGTKPLIILDAGHGGLDSGCVAINGEEEKNINLSIVKDLEQMLLFSGFEVILTRDSDVSVHDDGVEGIRNQKLSDMENRLEIINAYPDSVFISIHQNQYTEPQYFGGQMFYTTKNKTNFRFAQIMQECFAEFQTGNDREIKLIDNEIYLLKNAVQPSLLIECGFLSNANDAANLSDSEYQKKTAFNIYRGLMKYLEEVEKSEDKNGENPNTLYMQ